MRVQIEHLGEKFAAKCECLDPRLVPEIGGELRVRIGRTLAHGGIARVCELHVGESLQRDFLARCLRVVHEPDNVSDLDEASVLEAMSQGRAIEDHLSVTLSPEELENILIRSGEFVLADGRIVDIVPHCQGGSLEGLIQRLQEGEQISRTSIYQIMKQIFTAKLAMIKAGVLHRDMKPGNVLVSHDDSGDWRVMVADFGVSVIGSRDESSNLVHISDRIVGTRSHLAPEALHEYENSKSEVGDNPRRWVATEQTEIYAVGVMLYRLLTGKEPKLVEWAGSKDTADLTAAARKLLVSLEPENQEVNDPLLALVERMIAINPDRRPQAFEEIWDEFDKIDFKSLDGAGIRLEELLDREPSRNIGDEGTMIGALDITLTQGQNVGFHRGTCAA